MKHLETEKGIEMGLMKGWQKVKYWGSVMDWHLGLEKGIGLMKRKDLMRVIKMGLARHLVIR